MTQPSKRLQFLEKMVRSGTEDPMAYYGLAMEYRNLERAPEALALFQQLRARKPDYVAMYLMCGQMVDKLLSDKAMAREWLEAGIEECRRSGNTHALSELESALGEL